MAGLLGATSAHAEYADVSSAGVLADAASAPVGISDDGRYVLFSSAATNLVAGSPSGTQAYFRDRLAGTTTLPAPGYLPVAMSSSGRFLLLSRNGLFVFDRVGGGAERADVSTAGVPASSAGSATAGAISADGRFVVFSSTASNLVAGDANGARDVFLRDRQTGTTTLVSSDTQGTPGSGDSTSAAVSADGSVTSFSSDASDLVAGDDNGDADVFARPLGGATALTSVDSTGLQGPSAPPTQCAQSALNTNGRFVAFSCGAPNLAAPDLTDDQRTDHAYLRDRVAGTTVRADVDASGAVLSATGQLLSPTISGDGRRAAYWANATFPGHIVLWDAVPDGRARLLDVRGQAPLLSSDGLVLAYQDIPTSSSTAHVGVLALGAPVTDTQPPTVSCAAPDRAWHATDVAVACTASDSGSGLADGGSASFTLSTSVPPGTETTEATTSARTVCDLAGNCTTAGPVGPVQVDRKSPLVSCDGIPALLSRLEANVVASCTATDGGSGLADASGQFVLRTTVAGGATDLAAMTSSHTECDLVGNCATTGPFGPFLVDRLAAPPDERDSDSDGIDDAADQCPLTAGACSAEDAVPLPASSERAASVRAAVGAALATCSAPGQPSALSSVATAASKKAGAAAGTAIRALAKATCSSSLTTGAAALMDADKAPRARTAAVGASADLSPYFAQPRDLGASIERSLRICKKASCRKIVTAAVKAAQSASEAGADAVALAVARTRLRQARAAGDTQAGVAQAALVRVYEGSVSTSQDARAAAYTTFGKATSAAGVSTSLSSGPQAESQRSLSKGTAIPGQVRQDLQPAGLGSTDVTAALVQSDLNAKQPTVTAATARKPRTKSRQRIAKALAYDAVARVVIVLAARHELSFVVTGRLLNALDAARTSCTVGERNAALRDFAAAATGTKAAAFITTSVQLLQANTALAPRCH
ncbi:hypothetical protein [Conexibacter woesei]|uniref:hypothetical protein n=1 Tax=Conexibacter woesei TaxID=191495 RepID=UPI0012DCEC6E|nr:hypothetical protein [Conexibacter woesei]